MTNQQFALWVIRDAICQPYIHTDDKDLASRYKKLLKKITKEMVENPGDQDSVDYCLLSDYLSQYSNLCELTLD